MSRWIATAAVIALGSSLTLGVPVAARDAQECPPRTDVKVDAVGANLALTLKITVKNMCSCRITFRACSAEGAYCSEAPLEPGEEHILKLESREPHKNATFTWTADGAEPSC